MAKIAAYLLIGIAVGLGVAWWQGSRSVDELGDGFTLDQRTSLERRLSELETSLALERFERQALADELDELRLAVAEQPVSTDGAAPLNPRERIAAALNGDDSDPLATRLRQRFPDGIPQNPEEAEAFLRQRQLERYIEAGFSPERAQWIMQREDEIAMEVLQARYDATQSGASPEEVAQLNASQMLRAELGDPDYEKYLRGQGRPTAVNVRDVLSNSPAQVAGLQAGDQIVSYNGQRVFDINELTELTNQSRRGSTVAMDVVRDGQQIQVYVTSGPLGISGGGRSTRRGGAFPIGAPGGLPAGR